MKDLPKLIVSVVMCELVGIIAAPITVSAIPNWYESLTKPPFSPPNWVFAPVWTMLYFMMGISFFLVWREGWGNKDVQLALKFFLAQLSLNFLWSVLFFGLKSPLLGLINIVVLLMLIVITMQKFKKISLAAFYLLVPYLVWVGFATILNIAILILN